MKVKIMIFAVFLLIVESFNSLSAEASSMPTPPPNLELLKPRLAEIRGNAYQYGLESNGFDVRFNTTPLDVLIAIDKACEIADFVFADSDEYKSIIQRVNDRSGLPSSLSGLDAEIYFAKIDYLDMQIGVYLNSAGEVLGETLIQFKEEALKVLEKCIGSVEKNVLGKSDMNDYNFDLSLLQGGFPSADLNSYMYSYYHRDTSQPHNVEGIQILKKYPENQFFVVRRKGYLKFYCIGIPGRVPQIRVGRGYSKDKNEAHFWLYSPNTDDLFMPYTRKINTSVDFIQNGEYCLYSYEFLSWYNNSENLSQNIYSSFPVIWTTTHDEFENWFLTIFKPKLIQNKMFNGAVQLNPNEKSEKNLTIEHPFKYDDIVDRNKKITEKEPVFNPQPEFMPSPEVPFYEPVSPTLPEIIPVPKPMPDYSLSPDVTPEPTPDPAPDPTPDFDIPLTPIQGLKDKFPFCVPFDLIYAFENFSAESEIPVWTFDFYIPNLGINEKIIVDLTPFVGLAELSRMLLLIMFIISLILCTRRMIG